MNIYLLCPVRNMTVDQKDVLENYIKTQESLGHKIHSFKNVDQSDDTGFNIVMGHFEGMKSSDEIHVFWDVCSKGSHFDLGMALVFSELENKKIKLIKCFSDEEGKSYWKAISRYCEKGKEFKLVEKNENYYVESKIKPFGCCVWGSYGPLDSTETEDEAMSIIEKIKTKNKELCDKDSWKFRIMKRVEEHYVVKTIVGE
jgi:hypothetical protein